MNPRKLPSGRFPKVPIERRIYAFLIDFVVVWVISSLITNIFVEFFIFGILWFILRVIVVDRNQGQSLGRWALDMKVKDARFQKIPPLVSLCKREGIICVAAFLAMVGLKINFYNLLSMLLLITPLLIDGGIAISDEEFNQAFHDRVGETVIIQSSRGFSLDLRLKRLIQEIEYKLKQKRNRKR
jgi:uncharacterized RDD family membrane protein YckC